MTIEPKSLHIVAAAAVLVSTLAMSSAALAGDGQQQGGDDNPCDENPFSQACNDHTILSMCEASNPDNPEICEDLLGESRRPSVLGIAQPVEVPTARPTFSRSR